MKKFLLFGVFIGFVATAAAQKNRQVAGKTYPALIKINENRNRSEAQSLLKTHLELTANDQMQLLQTEADQIGFVHEKYQQYYKGLKVEGATYTVHSKAGKITSMSGNFRDINDVDIQPSITSNTAFNYALSHVHAQVYAWETAVKKGFPGYEKPQGELVVFADPSTNGPPTLAYKFDVYAAQPLYRAWIYIDASNGRILMENARIHNSNVAATASTLYNGTRSITADFTGSNYRLRQTVSGNGVETYSLNNGTNYGAATDITSSSSSFTSDKAANQAHWGAERTHNYFLSQHGRNSYDNAASVIRSYVHYSNNYVNAFWDGSRMTYGDGDGSSYGPLVSLDICGHEISHGVTEYSANLVYQREPGALNESFSDIFGEAIENFSLGSNDWLMGDDIGIGGSGAIRSMSNPGAFGDPDTYGGANWYNPNCSFPSNFNDYCGVHTNSGVQNKWFYILSVGENGTNDLGNAYSVSGIGIVKAAAIAYRNLTVYLSSGSSYADARSGAIQAAIDLYGPGSSEVMATTNAWYAVGVGCAYGANCLSYCTSNGSNSSYEWIKTVSIGSFTHNSNAAGYSNFTNLTIDLVAGNSYSTSLTPGFSSSTYNEYWKIWIDFNADGDFNDAGEQVFSAGPSTTTVSGNISIPASASGTTRMRVTMKYNSAPTSPCETFTYGEVEDYTVSFGTTTPDTEPPTAPVLSSTGATETTIGLSWTAATDNVGVTGYDVYVDGTNMGTTTATTFTVNSLTASTTYAIYVRAKDAAGNGTNSNTINESTQDAADTEPPTAPVLTSTGSTTTTIGLSWTAATDNIGVTGYDIYIDGSNVGTTATTAYTLTSLTPSTSYAIYVRAKDAAGNGTNSNTINESTQDAADTEPPTAPVLSSTGSTTTTIGLSWTAATDNVGVTGYDIYVDGSNVGTTATTAYTLTSLTPSTSYAIYVRAKDAAGNGTSSNTINVSTQSTGGPTTIFAHYFESGWDGWSSGGDDCDRYQGNRSYEGSYSIYVRDNSGVASSMTSAAYNLSAYNQVVLDFYFYAFGLKNGEDFWVRLNNGSGWTTVATFAKGPDFGGNGFYHATITLNGSFASNAQFRIQADASANNDLFYIDQVVLTGANTGSMNAGSGINKTCEPVSNSQGIGSPEVFTKNMLLYPNPATNVLTVQSDHVIKSARVYSSSGQMIKQFGALRNGTRLDVSTIKAGFYIVVFETENGLIQRKFIKQ